MRGYVVSGPSGTFLIDRERPRRFLVRGAATPPPFFNSEFRRLADARREAEDWAGL